MRDETAAKQAALASLHQQQHANKADQVCILFVTVCVVDILCSCKQGCFLLQVAFGSERKAKEEAYIVLAAAEEAAVWHKVGIPMFAWHPLLTLPTTASFCNTANPVLTCMSPCRQHRQS